MSAEPPPSNASSDVPTPPAAITTAASNCTENSRPNDYRALGIDGMENRLVTSVGQIHVLPPDTQAVTVASAIFLERALQLPMDRRCHQRVCFGKLIRCYRITSDKQTHGEPCAPDGRIGVVECPTISTFYGILIRMFFNDHPPPHFHARYGEFEATVEISTLEILEGELPRRGFESSPGMGDHYSRGVAGQLAVLSRKRRPDEN